LTNDYGDNILVISHVGMKKYRSDEEFDDEYRKIRDELLELELFEEFDDLQNAYDKLKEIQNTNLRDKRTGRGACKFPLIQLARLDYQDALESAKRKIESGS
jgi:hypothetical protein